MSVAISFEHAGIEQNRSTAEAIDCWHIMAHEEHRPPAFGDFAYLAQALFLKFGITNSQHFIDN